MEIHYAEEHGFTREELERLFLSVGWSSGHFPEKLVLSMQNFSTVVSYPLINSNAQILTVNFPSFCTEIACKPSGWLRDFCYI